MNASEAFILARTLHVLGVVIWIGGVAFVTMILVPSLRAKKDTPDRYALFEDLEERFGFHAKIATTLTGATGFYMIDVLGAWDRYLQWEYWWIHGMTLVWILFTLVLFVFEPWFLHRWFHEAAEKDDTRTLMLLQWMHNILFFLSIVTLLGSVAGAHGYLF